MIAADVRRALALVLVVIDLPDNEDEGDDENELNPDLFRPLRIAAATYNPAAWPGTRGSCTPTKDRPPFVRAIACVTPMLSDDCS